MISLKQLLNGLKSTNWYINFHCTLVIGLGSTVHSVPKGNRKFEILLEICSLKQKINQILSATIEKTNISFTVY